MNASSIARLIAHYLDARDDIANAHVGPAATEASAIVEARSQGDAEFLITVLAR